MFLYVLVPCKSTLNARSFGGLLGRPLSSVLICGEFSLRFLTGLCGMVKAQPLLPALETSVKKGRMPEIWRDQGERPTRSCCSTTFKGAGCVRRQKRVSMRTCWWNGIQCQSFQKSATSTPRVWPLSHLSRGAKPLRSGATLRRVRQSGESGPESFEGS